jgi:LCP family protein required for cell wall assembly
MGYGGKGHEGSYLTDTMMILRVDMEKKSGLMLSIPRDLWVKVPTKTDEDFHSKINAVYQMGLFPNNFPNIPSKYQSNQGAGDLIKEVVGKITGFPIDYYVTVDFEGFRKAVDILGGIDVVVAKTFDDFEYPITGHEDDLCGKTEADLPDLEKIATDTPEIAFPCRYEHLHFNAGNTHMDGETALKYVRSRHSAEDGGDFGRASRQQLFLDAVKNKVISIGFVPKIIPLLNELSDQIKTDVPLEVLNKFIGQASSSNSYKLSQLVLSDKIYIKQGYSENRQYILMPTEGIDQWKNIQLWIRNTIDGNTPTPILSPSQSQKPRQ